MYKMFSGNRVLAMRFHAKRFINTATTQRNIIYGDSVRHALEHNLPVVALESTIITHGMPYPQNVTCALECERQILQAGATPATISILNGRLTIGLTRHEIEHIGELKDVVKTSRRDLAHVVGRKLNGGTTVSGTILAAHMVGIKVMATGGIGGVHRSGETTMDISADLQEMGRTPIAVVSSGVKSILDIPRTLEYLESQGVYVATFGDTKHFPAFYTRDSGSKSPYNVTSSMEAAQVIKATHDLGLRSGMLFAVPVPEEYAMDSTVMENVIQEALKLAKLGGVIGKDITPFLLGHVARATEGKSLQTNMSLVQNNANVGGRIAVDLWKLQGESGECRKPSAPTSGAAVQPNKAPIVVIGGSVLDRCVTVLDDEIKLDGRIHSGKITESAGGVARNICDALSKLQPQREHLPVFISAVGDDESAKIITGSLQAEPITFANARTAQCLVVFDVDGDCRFLIGDMDVHGMITPSVIREHSDAIAKAPLIVLDANLSVDSMEEVFAIADQHRIPVFFEPTDYHCSKKPFQTSNYKAIKFISPNFNELQVIAECLGATVDDCATGNRLQSAAKMAKYVADYIDNVLVTLGEEGLLIARRHSANDTLLSSNSSASGGKVQIRHYPALKCTNLVNVSGAGDCLAAGLIAAMLDGRSEENCVNIGMHSSLCSLRSSSAIPNAFFDQSHACWKQNAKYFTMSV